MHSKLRPFSLHFMGKELFPVNTIEDLGIFLDSNYLTFNEHITKSVSSCMHRLSQVNCTKHIFNKHTLLITKVFNKHLRIRSSDIKELHFHGSMPSFSNSN